MRPVLIKRARATALPALVSLWYQVDCREKPGCERWLRGSRRFRGPEAHSAFIGPSKVRDQSERRRDGRACQPVRPRALPRTRCVDPPFCPSLVVRMSLSENRFPLFRDMRQRKRGHGGGRRVRPPTIRRAWCAGAAGEHDHRSARRMSAIVAGQKQCRPALSSDAGADHLAGALAPLQQPNGHGSAGQAETTGRGSGLAERASGLAERASGLTPRTAADRPWRRPERRVRRHRENDISLASAAGSGLLSGATSAVTCGTASALRSDLPPASAVTTAALNAKAARAAATVPRHPMTPTQPPPWRLRTR